MVKCQVGTRLHIAFSPPLSQCSTLQNHLPDWFYSLWVLGALWRSFQIRCPGDRPAQICGLWVKYLWSVSCSWAWTSSRGARPGPPHVAPLLRSLTRRSVLCACLLQFIATFEQGNCSISITAEHHLLLKLVSRAKGPFRQQLQQAIGRAKELEGNLLGLWNARMKAEGTHYGLGDLSVRFRMWRCESLSFVVTVLFSGALEGI